MRAVGGDSVVWQINKKVTLTACDSADISGSDSTAAGINSWVSSVPNSRDSISISANVKPFGFYMRDCVIQVDTMKLFRSFKCKSGGGNY
jgi:hypothetical protein